MKFNGTSASFTVNSDFQITATVPSGATTGRISVTTPGGTATSMFTFTVAGLIPRQPTDLWYAQETPAVGSPGIAPVSWRSGPTGQLTLSGSPVAAVDFGGMKEATGLTGLPPELGSRRPAPVAQLAALRLGLNGSSGGTAISFNLLRGVTSGSDTFSDEEGGDFRTMHLTLKPVLLAAGRQALTPTPAWRYSFYSPEMNLLSETEWTMGTPHILYEYIWFNGHPVAQVDAGIVTHWTFTDHLGTPIIQTTSAGNIYWQAEYEPYGKVFALRTVDQHQPLRLPGQEAEQLNLGPNGVTERSYNIFRWYRNGWGRYTQADPIGFGSGPIAFFSSEPPWDSESMLTESLIVDSDRMQTGDFNLFGYARSNPTRFSDFTGEAPINFDGPDRTMRTKGTGRICQIRGDNFRLRLDFASPGTVNNVKLPPRLHINVEIPSTGFNKHIALDPRTVLDKCGPLCRGSLGVAVRRIPVIVVHPCLLNPALPGCQSSPDL